MELQLKITYSRTVLNRNKNSLAYPFQRTGSDGTVLGGTTGSGRTGLCGSEARYGTLLWIYIGPKGRRWRSEASGRQLGPTPGLETPENIRRGRTAEAGARIGEDEAWMNADGERRSEYGVRRASSAGIGADVRAISIERDWVSKFFRRAI